MAKQKQPVAASDPASTKIMLAQLGQAAIISKGNPTIVGNEAIYPAAIAQVNGQTVSVTPTGDENDIVTLTTTSSITVNSLDQTVNNYTVYNSYGVEKILAGNNISISSNLGDGKGNVTINALVGNVALLNLDGNVSNVLRGDGTFSADANSNYGNSNVANYLPTYTGNIAGNYANFVYDMNANVVGANYLYGDGSNITNLNVGNIASINLDGNASNVLRGDGTFGPDANSSYGDSNVTSLLGSFGSNTISTTGNVSTGNINTTVTANAVGAGATVGVRSTLNIDSSFGSTDPNNPASAQGVRGRISGSNLTGNSNYLTGVTGQYLITGTNASDFIKAGVLGVVGDQTTSADAAVVAYLDGDGGLTTANAAYAVGMKNSTPGSGFKYGLDLQLLDFGLGLTSPYSNADIRLNNGVEIQSNTSGEMTVVGNIAANNLGNISSINLDGSNSNVLYGNGVFAPATTGNATLPIANGNSNFDIAAANGNVTITANSASTWTFGTDGLLTLPSGNVVIGNLLGADAIIASNTPFGVVSQGNASTVLQWIDDISNATALSAIYINSPSAGPGDVVVLTGEVGANANIWNFTANGVLSLARGNSTIESVANNAGDLSGLSTLNLVPDSSTGDDRYIIVDPTGPNHIHIRAGGVQDGSNSLLFLGGEQAFTRIDDFNHEVTIGSYDSANAAGFSWTFGNTGTLTIPGNLVASGASPAPTLSGFSSLSAVDSISVGNANVYSNGHFAGATATLTANVTALNIINTVTVYANLPAATTAGIRAFISDANLVAAGNFGATVGSGGSNTVPVYSDGANWCIG